MPVQRRAVRWIAGRATIGVLTLRLLPVAPFGLVSYAFGTTGVGLRAYLVGTALGAAPSIVVYASLGATVLSPGTPGFVISLLAAVTMGLAGTTAATLLARRQKGRGPASPPTPSACDTRSTPTTSPPSTTRPAS